MRLLITAMIVRLRCLTFYLSWNKTRSSSSTVRTVRVRFTPAWRGLSFWSSTRLPSCVKSLTASSWPTTYQPVEYELFSCSKEDNLFLNGHLKKKIHQIKREITQPVRTEFRFYASQNTTSNRSQWTSPALHHKAGINTMLIEVSYLYIVHVLYILIPKVYLAKSTYIYLQVFCLICPCIIFNVDLSFISK